MRLILFLCLLMSLSSCGRSTPPRDLSWVQPIFLSDETIAWLGTKGPLPSYVMEDLGQIFRLNEKVRLILHK